MTVSGGGGGDGKIKTEPKGKSQQWEKIGTKRWKGGGRRITSEFCLEWEHYCFSIYGIVTLLTTGTLCFQISESFLF